MNEHCYIADIEQSDLIHCPLPGHLQDGRVVRRGRTVTSMKVRYVGRLHRVYVDWHKYYIMSKGQRLYIL